MNNQKLDELRSYAVIKKLDVIGVAETWLNDSISNEEISIENFVIFRKDRSSVKCGRGGGVFVACQQFVIVD